MGPPIGTLLLMPSCAYQPQAQPSHMGKTRKQRNKPLNTMLCNIQVCYPLPAKGHSTKTNQRQQGATLTTRCMSWRHARYERNKKTKPEAGVDWAAKLKTQVGEPQIDARWPFRNGSQPEAAWPRPARAGDPSQQARAKRLTPINLFTNNRQTTYL